MKFIQYLLLHLIFENLGLTTDQLLNFLLSQVCWYSIIYFLLLNLLSNRNKFLTHH